MYYLQSRYYNPEWGRFINADGIIGQTGELLGHNLFAYCKNNPVNKKDTNGFMCSSASDGASTYKDEEPSLAERVLNTAVKVSNSKLGQVAIAFADSSIGNKIVKAAEENAANAWHDKPLGTLALSKMLPKESSLLQRGKGFIEKGGGILAVAALGLNAWDDFHNHGLIAGGKRFGVDFLSATVGTVIGVATAELPGGIVWGTGISMAINDAIFDPWKNSVN